MFKIKTNTAFLHSEIHTTTCCDQYKKFVQLPYTTRTPAAGDSLSFSKTVRFEVSVVAPPTPPSPLSEEVSK